MDRWVWHWWSK